MTADLNLSPCEAGKVFTLSPRVRRLTAPNPGPLTGPGTNTYILGEKYIVVLDPGPADPGHINAILAATNHHIDTIVVTHTHDDHSPAACHLAEKTGAVLLGCTQHDDGYQDNSFRADRQVQHAERLETPELTLEAIYTPGHVGNHFCYLLKEEGMLFSGDHLMEGSTVVIIPPGGDMADYLTSLQRLLEYPLHCIAPGHGRLIADPLGYIKGVIAHRLKREQKVIDGLKKAGISTLEQLTPIVYDDVAPAMHGIASLSLWAHLLKLEKEGRAVRHSPPGSGGHPAWQLSVLP